MNFRYIRLCFFVFLTLEFYYSSAQTIVNGTLTDDEGEALIGVTVRIKGTEKGTITDLDGNYQLATKEGDVLVFSYIGFKTKEVEFTGQEKISLSLEVDLDELEEVIVIGYGTRKKSDITGSTGVMTSRDVDLQPVQRVENMLQGRVAGVVVQQNSGAPGSQPKVNIRGFDGTPTYVIDGFIDADINAINPSDIESISVLKDASATAIYGSRGANGVILVTTKKSRKETPFVVNADYYHTISQLYNRLDLLEPLQYMQIVNQKLIEAGASEIISESKIDEARSNPNFGTNWQDQIFRVAHSNNANLNVSKGWKDVGLRLSMGARKDQGIIVNTNYQRLTSRLNFNANLTEKTKISLIGGYTQEKNHNNNNDSRADGSNPVVAAATAWSPNLPVIDPATGDYQGFVGYGATVRRNPVYLAREIDADGLGHIFNGGLTLDHKLTEAITAKASYGMQYVKTKENTFRRFEPASDNPVSEAPSSKGTATKQQWNLQLDYQKALTDKHEITMTVVGEIIDREEEINRFLTTYNPDGSVREQNVKVKDPYDYEPNAQISFLSRLHYDFMEKILLTGSYRYDASSRLSAGEKWDNFFSGAIAYRMSDEIFMSDISWLRDLKLRLGYGEIGNTNSIQAFQIQGLTNPDISGYAFDGIDISSAEGFPDNSFRINRSLVWERSRTINGGFDLVMLDGQIELNVDYYQKFTEDAIFDNQVPQFLGGGSIKTNSGRFKNNGIEVALTHQWNTNKNYNVRSTLNIALNKSEVLALPQDSIFRGERQGGFDQQSHILIQGKQIGLLWGYKYLGVKKEGIDTKGELPFLKDGDAIYEDINGDGQLTVDDMQVIGSGHPNFVWGFNTFIDYKNFSLNFFVQGIHGQDVINLPKHGLLGGGAGVLDATSTEIFNSISFFPNLGNGSLPSLNANYRSQSSLFVEDGSFIRLKNITLGYTLPSKLLESMKIQNLRVYAGVQNLLTITDYKGYDPEARSGDSNRYTPGVDTGAFPIPRTYTFGFNLNF